MERTRVVETQVYADHTQLYVVDPEFEYRTDLVWDGRGLERHPGVSPGITSIGTIGSRTGITSSTRAWSCSRAASG